MTPSKLTRIAPGSTSTEPSSSPGANAEPIQTLDDAIAEGSASACSDASWAGRTRALLPLEAAGSGCLPLTRRGISITEAVHANARDCSEPQVFAARTARRDGSRGVLLASRTATPRPSR